jgi:hypothetical protein
MSVFANRKRPAFIFYINPVLFHKISLVFKRCPLFLAGLFFAVSTCWGAPLLETEGFSLSIDTYFRPEAVAFKNIIDLDSANSDDSSTYLALDYSLGLNLEFKDGGPIFHLLLERNGPYDCDMPLFIHNTLMNSAGRIEAYRNDELLPQLEEFWVDTPLLNDLRLKLGLYTYRVGNAFSLNGAYENYGFTIFRESPQGFNWHLYYCRPDLVYKNHLGPRIRQDEEQGIDYNHNAANFFAADASFNLGKASVQPYVGLLADYTSAQKRDNYFSAPIKEDILGTLGLAWDWQADNLHLSFEGAHNFGRAKSEDSAYKDIYHTGYLVYTQADYQMGKFKPSAKFLLCSGNKLTPEMALNQDATLTSAKNRAFSYYSPLNQNLGDSIAGDADYAPIVTMSGGCGLNYGVPRPGVFSASDFANLIMPSLGFDLQVTDKFAISLWGYYLRSFAKPIGTLNGEGKYLSRDLGYEADLFIDYQLNKNILLSFSAGYFFPGRYYKEKRDDTEGSLFSPYLRADGQVDSAYQIELAAEVEF